MDFNFYVKKTTYISNFCKLQFYFSQERAYWRVYRPPPGYTTVVESSPVPTREHRIKARSRTKEHISEEVSLLY